MLKYHIFHLIVSFHHLTLKIKITDNMAINFKI